LNLCTDREGVISSVRIKPCTVNPQSLHRILLVHSSIFPNKTTPRIRILEKKLLSDNWYKLWRYSYEYQHNDGTWETQQREAYMSPGSVTEVVHFFIAAYSNDLKISAGGGKYEEQENIEVLEMLFTEALEKVKCGKIRDGKTIMLLQYAQLHNLMSE